MTSKVTMNFVIFFSLHHLIKVPTRITCNSATIIDHILASYLERVTQQGIIDVGLSDHQLIFCKRKIYKIKRGTHKHIKFRSFKHHSADLFKATLTSINFPNYQSFNGNIEAYDDFIQKIMVAIDKVAPIKERRINIIPRNGLMVKFLKQLQIVISY